MKLAMAVLPWSMPKTTEGAGKVKELPYIIQEKGISHVLIVTGKHILSYHLLDDMLLEMDKLGMVYSILCSSNNPTDEDVEKGVISYRDNACEAIVAFGGGSPMDCAKAIGARLARPNKTITQLQGQLKVLKKTPPIFAVPTTSGTGSETTMAAVITDSKSHHKASINDLRLIPEYAVLDPELTVGLPPQVTANTGLDALCHAVEAYTNQTYNTKLENDLCLQAVKLIYDNLYIAYCDGNNLEARQKMQQAAFYAGRAFTRGCVGYVHAIGHTLGGLYGVPHGSAMGILLPHVLRRYGHAVDDRLAELCDICGIKTKEKTSQAKAEAFIMWIEEIKEQMNIPHYPSFELEDLNQIANWAHQEANPLYPTPVILSKEEIKEFLLNLK